MRNMNLMKKLAVLGIIGTLVVGQSVSALAVTGYYLSAPLVTKMEPANGVGYRIKARVQVSSDYSHSYLVAEEKLRYYVGGGLYQYTETAKSVSNVTISSYIYDPIFSGRGIGQSQFDRAIAEGYYTNSVDPKLRNDIHIGHKETAIN